MASTSSLASTSSTISTQELRSQAGPLPSKRGEIGFVESVHDQPQVQSQHIVQDSDVLPTRHPADLPSPTPSPDPTNEAPSHLGSSQTSSDSSSTNTTRKPSFLRNRKLPKFLGLHFTTLAMLCIQSLLLVGTIVGWVFAALIISKKVKVNPSSQGPLDNQDGPPPPDSSSSDIFIHVAFAVVALAQIVFLERRIFRLRAERYIFKHPGEILPNSLQRGNSGTSAAMPMAPWSRPPLPTYAAAIAASGFGTGDVEDAEIAQPPPPAYGKTRGSTLLLAGFMTNSLRVRAREHEQDRRVSVISERSDRPVSFLSRDEEWEERRDAERARRTEEALATLEEGQIHEHTFTTRSTAALT
ncbi:hypothetical protein B0F90DRAFT_1625799 [Multifurca ochricompacta]|uniref:Uncharacterized protein n=1 Tax=Multifurca ochricompacta TaxID=376703 RepID=A0AAD4M999_9AGAM|nr:hypothetical protein B0F90DRAFT_1625799 [Multifurca ochricompacta]